jgi:hypothetical protein
MSFPSSVPAVFAAIRRKFRPEGSPRKNRMVVYPSRVSGGKIVYQYRISGGWAKCFWMERSFRIDYPFNLKGVPESVRIVPFLSQVMPVAWVCDAEVRVPVLDRDFRDCLEAVKGGYRAMHPAVRFGGALVANRLETNAPAKGAAGRPLACFSGGVDALATTLRHLAEKPVLTGIWGSDVAAGDEEGWKPVEVLIRANAEKLSLESAVLRSSFRDLLRTRELDPLVAASGDNWWHGFQHGLGILGHMAPVAWAKGAKTVYIASSYTAADKCTCASDPSIDNHVRFCGAAAVHDAYEWNRQDKVRRIVEHARESGVAFPLHVCWVKKGGDNCCHCEKCWRTMLALWAEGADPRDFGFAGFEGFASLPADRERDARNFLVRTEPNYGPIQARLRSRFAEKDIPAELLWLWNGDFASPA